MNTSQKIGRAANRILKLAFLTAGTILVSLSAQAATSFNYDFSLGGGTNSGSGFGNLRTFTSNGITVSVTAWGVTGNSNTTLQTAQLGEWTNYGLGVCNRNETADCAVPNHQVSNENGYDFVLFQFSTPVALSSITINPYDPADRDVSYYLGTAASNLNLTGVGLNGLAALGFGNVTNNDSTYSGLSRIITLNSGTVNSLLFGARVNGDTAADFFKISDLAGNTSQAPEPATFGMLGAALVGLGVVRKRLQK